MTPQEQACDIAQKLLDGTLSLVEACRSIQWPLEQLSLRTDADFVVFITIDSEADELPLGPQRRYWNKDVLAKRDEEIVAFEHYYRPHAEDACRAVIRRLRQGD